MQQKVFLQLTNRESMSRESFNGGKNTSTPTIIYRKSGDKWKMFAFKFLTLRLHFAKL